MQKGAEYCGSQMASSYDFNITIAIYCRKLTFHDLNYPFRESPIILPSLTWVNNFVHPTTPLISLYLHTPFAHLICSTLLHSASNSAGEATRMQIHRARLVATLRRLGLNKKFNPRGASWTVEAAREEITTGASRPWHLSTVPMFLAKSGMASVRASTWAL